MSLRVVPDPVPVRTDWYAVAGFVLCVLSAVLVAVLVVVAWRMAT